MKRFLVILGGFSWMVQAFLLPAIPLGVWPNVTTMGLFGFPPFLFVHVALSLFVVIGLFSLSSIYLSQSASSNV